VGAVNNDVDDFGLIRSHGKVLEKCEACRTRDKMEDSEPGLLIEYQHGSLVLCALHESQLLERLIINHCKRARKRAAKGHKPDYYVRKLEEAAEKVTTRLLPPKEIEAELKKQELFPIDGSVIRNPTKEKLKCNSKP
jgi:hypothetical protein